MKYSFDTSAFVNPFRRSYPRDVFPGLWRIIDSEIDDGNIVASIEVLNELQEKEDALLEYVKSRGHMFIELDDE